MFSIGPSALWAVWSGNAASRMRVLPDDSKRMKVVPVLLQVVSASTRRSSNVYMHETPGTHSQLILCLFIFHLQRADERGPSIVCRKVLCSIYWNVQLPHTSRHRRVDLTKNVTVGSGFHIDDRDELDLAELVTPEWQSD